MEVCHINDIKTDNRLCNLRYGTRSDNMEDAVRNGRHQGKRVIRSDGVIFRSIHDAARKSKTYPHHIRNVLKGKYTHTKGYNFMWEVDGQP